eukprot:PhM_4_TR13983/c1_g2_i1/m.81621/K18342/OTUD6; OTU domain-containing protein 6
MPPKKSTKTPAQLKKQRERDRARREKDYGVQEGEQFDDTHDTMRELEEAKLGAVLAERSWRVVQVAADGDCLFSAVADQLGGGKSGADVRKICAAELRRSPDMYSPFLHDEGISYDAYCDKMENTAAWGGQVEIVALANALDAKIVVVRASGVEEYGSTASPEAPELVVSYHEHMYASGAHYNSVRRQQEA